MDGGESERKTRSLSSCDGGGGQDHVSAKPGGLHIFLPRRPVRSGPDHQAPQVLTANQRFGTDYRGGQSPDSPPAQHSSQAPQALGSSHRFGMSLKRGESLVNGNNPLQRSSRGTRLTSNQRFGVSLERGQRGDPPLQQPQHGPTGATFEVSRAEPGQSPCYGVVHVKVVQCEGSLCKVTHEVGLRLGRAWHHLVTFFTFLKVFLAKWCPPKWLMALMVVVPLLALSGLQWWGDRGGLLPTLPAVINVTTEVWRNSGDSERVLRLEQSIAMLWEHMEDYMNKITRQLGEERRSRESIQQQNDVHLANLERILQIKKDIMPPTATPDNIKEIIAFQVKEEIRSILYGSQLGSNTDLPTSYLIHDLLRWLSHRYINEDDFHSALAGLERRVQQKISQHFGTGCGGTGTNLMKEEIEVIVKDVLKQFSQDQTGMADYALESAGGSILDRRTSKTYMKKTAQIIVLGVPVYVHNSPCTAIQPENQPGKCWPFQGSHGYLGIRLSMKIVPTSFSLEHISKALAPGGAIDSAPRDFRVYGLDREDQEEGTLLGSYTYEEDGEPVQTYAASEEKERAFELILVEVLSNWGHPEYTCIYRFRVHGTPPDNPGARTRATPASRIPLPNPTDSSRSDSTEGSSVSYWPFS